MSDVEQERKKGTVVVIGGGLAGLVATHSAITNGAERVVLVDKEPKLGGNSAKATSGMNACPTPAQEGHGAADDSPASFLADTLTSGHGKSRAPLCDTLTHMSESAWAYLRDECGATLDDVSQCGGHAHARTHRFSPGPDGRMRPVGFGLIQQLQGAIEKAKTERNGAASVEILTGTKCTGLLSRPSVDLVHPGEVNGVRVVDADGNEKEIHADAVVMAAGGYGNDHAEDSLLVKHAPQVAQLASTNGLQATGDAVRMGTAVGAQTVDLDQVQVHPTGLVDPKNAGSLQKFLGPEALRGKGGVLLGARGTRFTNELGRRDDVTRDIFEHGADYATGDEAPKAASIKVAYLVMSEAAVASYGSGTIGFYASKGFFTACEGPAAVAELIGGQATAESVTTALREYHGDADAGKADAFGRENRVAAPGPEGKLMVAIITPVVHYTMGGLLINASAEVLYKTNHGNLKPIPGLFAAGEASGGVHGGNRLAGNSLLECVVFGRIAGRRAAAAATLPRHLSPMGAHDFVTLTLSERECLGGAIYRYAFELPSPFQCAGLGVGQYVHVRATIDGEEVVRPYSPLTRPGDCGRIELMVKAETAPTASGKPPGKMSSHFAQLRIGDTLDFAGPIGGPDIYGARATKIGMIAGGTGIAPMLSVIRTVFRERSGHVMRLMYGAMTPAEMPFVDTIEAKAKERNDFDVYLSLDKPPTDGSWTHKTGFISAENIKDFMYPPQEGLLIIVCGPPPMCKAIKAALKDCGYPDSQVYSYM